MDSPPHEPREQLHRILLQPREEPLRHSLNVAMLTEAPFPFLSTHGIYLFPFFVSSYFFSRSSIASRNSAACGHLTQIPCRARQSEWLQNPACSTPRQTHLGA